MSKLRQRQPGNQMINTHARSCDHEDRQQERKRIPLQQSEPPAQSRQHHQYLGSVGSMSADQASMPPRRDWVFSKPWLRSQTATFMERTPWWQTVTKWASGSSSWKAREGMSPMGIRVLPSMWATWYSQGSRTSRMTGLSGLAKSSNCFKSCVVIS